MSFRINPDSYASYYATQNNMSLDDTKSYLRANFGEPTRPNQNEYYNSNRHNMSIFGNNSFNSFKGNVNKTFSNSFSYSRPFQNTDPETYARQYAFENGLSIDEAKTELETLYGKPEQNMNFLA